MKLWKKILVVVAFFTVTSIIGFLVKPEETTTQQEGAVSTQVESAQNLSEKETSGESLSIDLKKSFIRLLSLQMTSLA